MRWVTVETERRREQTRRRMGWILQESMARDAGRAAPPTAWIAGQDDARRRLDKLDEQIRASHDRIAALLHARNARPDDEDIRLRLQQAFEQTRLMQQERAERMSVYFHPQSPVPSEADSELIREALKILEHYESSPLDDLPPDDPLHTKP